MGLGFNTPQPTKCKRPPAGQPSLSFSGGSFQGFTAPQILSPPKTGGKRKREAGAASPQGGEAEEDGAMRLAQRARSETENSRQWKQKSNAGGGGQRTTGRYSGIELCPSAVFSVLRYVWVGWLIEGGVKKRTDRRWPSHGAQDPLAGRTVGRTLGGRVINIVRAHTRYTPARRVLFPPLRTAIDKFFIHTSHVSARILYPYYISSL